MTNLRILRICVIDGGAASEVGLGIHDVHVALVASGIELDQILAAHASAIVFVDRHPNILLLLHLVRPRCTNWIFDFTFSNFVIKTFLITRFREGYQNQSTKCFLTLQNVF